MNMKFGTLKEDLSPNGTAPALFDDGDEIVCHNILPETIYAGLKVVAFWDEQPGRWEIIQAECPE